MLSKIDAITKPLDIPPYIFVIAHPILRNYIKYERFSEVDIDYDLYPSKIERKDEICPSRELIQDQPGYCGTLALNMIPSRLFGQFSPYYQPPPENISVGTFIDTSFKRMSDPITTDKFSDSDSDTQNKLKMKIPKIDEFIAAFEKDDPKIKGKPSREQKRDSEWKLNSNINEERKGLMSYIPTAMQSVNKAITQKRNIQSLF